MYIHIYTYIYIHIHIYTSTYTYIYIYIFVCVGGVGGVAFCLNLRRISKALASELLGIVGATKRTGPGPVSHPEPWEDPKNGSTQKGSRIYTIGVLESRIGGSIL